MKNYDPVKIRYKQLINGRRSIYLDYTLADGTRKAEYLKMYLLPGRTPDVKRLNEHTLRAVANIKAQRLTNIAWNREPNDGVELSKRLLFDVVDEYAELRTRRGAKSAEGHYRSLKHHVSRLKADVRLWEVNVEFINELSRCMMQKHTFSGKPLAKSTITSVLSSLNSVLNYAVRKGMIKSNPMNRFDMRQVKGTQHRRSYLTNDELKRLAGTPCEKEDYKRLFLFACFVGLRFGDLISLRWSDVVEDGGLVRIEKMMQKTRRMVYVPLNKTALSYLPQREENSALVFRDIPSSTSQVNHVLKDWAQRAGIEKRITFYTARHTFATLSLTQGADLYSVSQLLGHRDIKTTEGYAQIINVKREQAMYLIDTLFTDYLMRRNTTKEEWEGERNVLRTHRSASAQSY